MSDQESLFPDDMPVPVRTAVVESIAKLVQSLLQDERHPSAWELLEATEKVCADAEPAEIRESLKVLAGTKSLPRAFRDYASWLIASTDLRLALDGERPPRREFESTLDDLFHASNRYRGSNEFQETIEFIGRFKDYAPFNNALVRLQNPSCGFFATQKDWHKRFGRFLIEDARPMIILAPMHPVLLVYDLEQTEGPPLPAELETFSHFEGSWGLGSDLLSKTLTNAAERDLIRVDFKPLSKTHGGFATYASGDPDYKMRVAVHQDLDEPSRYGVVCHELAHIYLGHLGSDPDGWWPARRSLDRRTVEIEAEAVAYIVTTRAGLSGSSSRYISRYLARENVPKAVSLDLIAKVAGRIEEMGRRKFGSRKKQ
ncbi:MAG: hypothetical protein AB2605_02650 [Candidatus Thiodiazotropha sp.]